MALQMTVDGNVQTPVPGSSSTTPIQLGAHATLEGTLATATAQLELKARVSPAPGAAPTGSAAPSTAEAMQADVQATLAPWAPQPVQAATATLRAVNLAALWPQAPATQLHGSLQAGPAPAGTTNSGTTTSPTTGWSLEARLRNDLPGPWDQARLPLTALQASASYDGSRWDVPGATLQAGGGSAAVQGPLTPPPGALPGPAEPRGLRPAAPPTARATRTTSSSLRIPIGT